MVETLLGIGAKEIGTSLGKFAFETFKAGIFKAWSLEKAQRAAIEYSERFAQHQGQIKGIGMDKPVPVRDIYTSVRVVQNSLAFATREELEKTVRREGARAFSKERDPSRSGIEVANEHQFLSVLGGPGAGKSTFLRRIGLEALIHKHDVLESFFLRKDLHYKHKCLPVFIELKTLKVKSINLLELIQEQLEDCGFPSSFAETALSKGKFLILLDGIDEIPLDKIDEAVVAIRGFINRHDKNRYITSCRTAFYEAYFTRFTDVALTEFDDNQIENFVHNWFRSDVDKEQKVAEQFFNTLKRSDNTSTLELARSPLLLTFICLVQNDRQNLPSTRTSLYKYALEILLEKWAAHKRIHQEPIYVDAENHVALKADLETVMLAKIAGESFSGDKLFFNSADLKKQISTFLQDTLNAPKHLDAKQVLKDIEIRQGLLVQRAHDVYSFSHLTLQEYLAACYHAHPQRMSKAIAANLFSTRWREVFLLMAGMDTADSELMVEDMCYQCQRFALAKPKLEKLLGWTIRFTKADTDTEINIGHRASLIFFVITILLATARDNARDLVRSPVKDLDLIRQTEHARIFAKELTSARNLAVGLALTLLPKLTTLLTKCVEKDSERAFDLDLEKDSEASIVVPVVSKAKNSHATKITAQQKTEIEVGLGSGVQTGSHGKSMDMPGDLSAVRASPLDGDRELDLEAAKSHCKDLQNLGCFTGDIQALKNNLSKMRNLRSDALWYERTRYSSDVSQILFEGLHLAEDLRSWSLVDIKNLVGYLYVNVLLIQCKSLSLSLSASKWAEIKSNLFHI